MDEGPDGGVEVNVSILDELWVHPCHAAAVVALGELEQQAHGHPIEARACDDGSIALELRGDRWRVLLSLEPDHTESGWHWVRIEPAKLASGDLGDIARLGPLIRSCLDTPSATRSHPCGGECADYD